MALTDADLEKVACLLRERPAVSCTDSCVYKSTDKHDKAHEVLDRWIANDIAKKEKREKLEATVIAGTILLILGSLGSFAVMITNFVKEHWK